MLAPQRCRRASTPINTAALEGVSLLNVTARLFNIHRGEGRLLALLLGVSFCLGLTRLFTQTAAGTLFLVMFSVEQLPLVYISVALVVPVIGVGYDWLGRRVALPPLLLTNLGSMAALLGVLWLSILLTDARWPAFALAVAYEVVWAMTSVCLWGLASNLLTLRQGKRLFGLISAGDVLAATLGGLLTPTLVELSGTPSLLLGALSGLVGAALLVRQTARAFAGALATPIEEPSREQHPGPVPSVQHRYMALVLILAMVSYVSFYCIDNLFYGQVEARYPDEQALASFLGIFWALVNALTLVCNLFLVSPLLSRYGLRGGLLVLPLVTVVPGLALVLGGTLSTLPALVFWMLITINLLDWVFRETIQKASLLTLYQPLPVLHRLRLQARVESVGQPVAQGLAGLALLGLGMLGFGTLQLSSILVALLAVCIVLSLVVGRSYARVLLQALARRRLDGATLTLADGDSLALISQGLSSPHPGAVIYALDLLESIAHPALANSLSEALAHSSSEVRREVLARVERLSLIAARDRVRRLAADDPDLRVRGTAVRTLLALDGNAFEEVVARLDAPEPELRLGAMVGLLCNGGPTGALVAGERLLRMVQSPAPAERIIAAQVLGEVGTQDVTEHLVALLDDAELPVRRAAIMATGKLRNPQLAPLLIAALNHLETWRQASAALVACGAPVMPVLAGAIEHPALSHTLTIRILRVAGQIGGAGAATLLALAAESPVTALRHEALLALNRRGFGASGIGKEQLQRILQAETAAMADLLSAQADLGPATDSVVSALLDTAIQEAVSQSRERLLLALACQYDAEVIRRVRRALAQPLVEQRAYAIELLDILLAHEHRPLIALFGDDQPPAQRLKQLNLVKLPAHGRVDRLHQIASSPESHFSSWIRTCARAELVHTATGLEHEQIGAAAMLSLIERVLILKTVSLFVGIPDSTLAALAALLEEQDLAAGEALFRKGDPGECMYIIVAGRLRVHDDGRLLNELGERAIVGEMALLDGAPRVASVTALEETRLLRLDQEALYELMADYIEVARGIIHVLSGHLRARVQDVADLRARVQELEKVTYA